MSDFPRVTHAEWEHAVQAAMVERGAAEAEMFASMTLSVHFCTAYGCPLLRAYPERTCAYHSRHNDPWAGAKWHDVEVLHAAKRRFVKGQPKGGKVLARAALGLPSARQRTERYSGPPRRGFVYRLYDGAGRLLYVGKTYSVKLRLFFGPSSHAKTKPWWPEVRRVTVTTYRTEADALAAEAWAIKRENPIHNIDRPAPWTPRSPRRICQVAGELV